MISFIFNNKGIENGITAMGNMKAENVNTGGDKINVFVCVNDTCEGVDCWCCRVLRKCYIYEALCKANCPPASISISSKSFNINLYMC